MQLTSGDFYSCALTSAGCRLLLGTQCTGATRNGRHGLTPCADCSDRRDHVRIFERRRRRRGQRYGRYMRPDICGLGVLLGQPSRHHCWHSADKSDAGGFARRTDLYATDQRRRTYVRPDDVRSHLLLGEQPQWPTRQRQQDRLGPDAGAGGGRYGLRENHRGNAVYLRAHGAAGAAYCWGGGESLGNGSTSGSLTPCCRVRAGSFLPTSMREADKTLAALSLVEPPIAGEQTIPAAETWRWDHHVSDRTGSRSRRSAVHSGRPQSLPTLHAASVRAELCTAGATTHLVSWGMVATQWSRRMIMTASFR